MKRIALWAAVGISLVLLGCVVPSVYPFYTEKDLVFDAGLVGTWAGVKREANDKETWTFEKSDELTYKFTINDMDTKGKTNVLTAHLFKLRKNLFMDCMFISDESGIPPHYLLKVAQIQPHLKFSFMKFDKMEELLEKNPDALRHLVVHDDPKDKKSSRLVLTADTKELQKFVLQHIGDTNLFEAMDDMERLYPVK